MGVRDILIFAVGRFSGRHRYEVAVVTFDNFDVVNHKTVVDNYRGDRAELGFVAFYKPDSYV